MSVINTKNSSTTTDIDWSNVKSPTLSRGHHFFLTAEQEAKISDQEAEDFAVDNATWGIESSSENNVY